MIWIIMLSSVCHQESSWEDGTSGKDSKAIWHRKDTRKKSVRRRLNVGGYCYFHRENIVLVKIWRPVPPDMNILTVQYFQTRSFDGNLPPCSSLETDFSLWLCSILMTKNELFRPVPVNYIPMKFVDIMSRRVVWAYKFAHQHFVRNLQ